MYHIKQRALALAAAVLLLAGCGQQGQSPPDQSAAQPQPAQSTSAVPSREQPAKPDVSSSAAASVPADGSGSQPGPTAPQDAGGAAEQSPSASEPAQPEPQPEPELFSQLPETFVFSSGAGAWSTELTIKDDGSFTGDYHDTDMGDSGEGYDSTVYQCQFSGRFTPPVQQGPYIYSMELEFIHLYDTPGNEVIQDRVRYVAAEPYGLDNAREVMLYLPGARLADLPEYFLLWTDLGPKEEVGQGDTLAFYGLYNVNESEGFAGYDG